MGLSRMLRHWANISGLPGDSGKNFAAFFNFGQQRTAWVSLSFYEIFDLLLFGFTFPILDVNI